MKNDAMQPKRASTLFLVLLLATFAAPGCRRRPNRAPFQAKVVGISDGDTITVLYGTTRVKVRLNGIDCPERGQPFGSRAKQFTADLAFGRTVTVRPFGKDRYGRVLGDVVLPDGRILNEELVAAGMAWHYTRYSKDATLARLERRAREAGLGVWSEGRAVAPWEFREAQGGKPR